MKNLILLFSIQFFSFYLNAQTPKNEERISLYFASGKFNLTPYHRDLIDKTIELLADKTITSMALVGYTDNTGDEKSNLALSEQRTKIVADFLYEKNIVEQEAIKLDFKGQNAPINTNQTSHERQKNRRVDVYFYYETPTKKQSKQPVVATPSPAIPIATDPNALPPGVTREGSNVRVPNVKGTSFSMTETDYRKYSPTMRFESFIDLRSMQKADLTTMTADGEPLMSAGMFNIDPTGIPGKSLDTPMVVRVPVPRTEEYANSPKAMKIWIKDPNGNWIQPDSVNVVREYDGNGKVRLFYEFPVTSATFVNLDKPFSQMTEEDIALLKKRAGKMKGRELRAMNKRIEALQAQWGTLNFELKSDSFQVLDVRLAYNDPKVIIKAKASNDKKGQFTAKTKVFKYVENTYYSYKKYLYPTVYATALNPQGDTVIMKYRSIHGLETDYRSGYGKEGYFNFVGILPYRARSLYKNYYLNERSFVLKTPKKPTMRKELEKPKVGSGE